MQHGNKLPSDLPWHVRRPRAGPGAGRVADEVEHDHGAIPHDLSLEGLADGDGLHKGAIAPVEPAYRLA